MPIQLIIIMNEDGTITMNGPLQQKVLCFGLLIQGMFLVENYKGDQIVPGGEIPMGILKGGRG